MVSIGSLRYDVIADTQQFQTGMAASRRELSAAKKVFLDTRTPVEMLGIEIEGLRRLLKSGALTQDDYNRAVRRLKTDAATTKTELKGLNTTVSSLSGSFKTLVGAYAGFAGIRMTLRSVNDEMKRIDETAKTARKLGLAASDLVALQLAGSQLAGMADGAVSMALQRMTRRLAEAAAGTGEAKNAIKELGLDAKSLNLMGPAEAFKAIADAIQEVPEDADKLRLAFKLFDSEGAALVNVLREGGSTVDDFKAKAHSLGLTFTDDAAAGVESANDAIQDANLAMKEIIQTMATGLAPVLKLVADGFVSVKKGARAWAEYLRLNSHQSGSRSLQATSDELDRQRREMLARLDPAFLAPNKNRDTQDRFLTEAEKMRRARIAYETGPQLTPERAAEIAAKRALERAKKHAMEPGPMMPAAIAEHRKQQREAKEKEQAERRKESQSKGESAAKGSLEEFKLIRDIVSGTGDLDRKQLESLDKQLRALESIEKNTKDTKYRFIEDPTVAVG